MVLNQKETPFEPGIPVHPENFSGRKKAVFDIVKHFNKVSKGHSKHFVITAEKGLGKSSFARYLSKIATKDYNMISVHLYLSGTHDVDSLIQFIIKKIVSETEENWRDKILGLFKENIKKVGIGGLNLEFNVSKEELKILRSDFSRVLVNIINQAGFNEDKGKKGLFIVLDDINGLTETPDFPNWYKSFADTLATDFDGKAPICIVLSGLPEKQEKLYEQNTSFNRIFDHMEIGKLKSQEIKDFYTNAFTKSSMSIEPRALDTMINYCSGFPTLMQEIGERVFWIDNDYHIDESDAFEGIIEAGIQIGQKHLKPIIRSQITNEDYVPIIKKFGQHTFHTGVSEFSENEMLMDFKDEEIPIFKKFLAKAEKTGIIESVDKKKCSYKFTSNLYPVFFKILKLKYEYEISN